MRHRVLLAPLLVLFLLLSGCGLTGPRAIRPVPGHPPDAGMVLPKGYSYPAADTFTVVTWNVEHFVDPYDNPYIENEREDAPEAGLERRRHLFAEAIRQLDADVVVLQEFESAAYLEALAEEHFPEMGYRFFAGTESPTWYQNVVLMSRLPLGVVRSFTNVTTPIEGLRDEEKRQETQSLTNHRLWIADIFARPGYTFSLAGVHLKAGQTERDQAWRYGQIRFLHQQFADLLALRPQANLLIAGDLNATPDTREFKLLLNRRGATAFVDPARRAPAPTHPSEAPLRRIDHLLPNEFMATELRPGSLRVAYPLPVDQMVLVSDHLPVMATFVAQDLTEDGTPVGTAASR